MNEWAQIYQKGANKQAKKVYVCLILKQNERS